MEEFHMANDRKSLLNDEILHSLYKNASFQALEEIQQQQFITQYKDNKHFVGIMNTSISLQEMIHEVEATMPKMQVKDFLLKKCRQKHYLKQHTVIEGNVYFVPFNEVENLFSPMVIAMQQSKSMEAFEAFCKGTILPLFHLCATQKRDLIIIPFTAKAHEPFIFKNGVLEITEFQRFIEVAYKADAAIVPVIKRALAIFEQDLIDNSRDFMIITDNQFTDFQELMQQEFEQLLGDLAIDVSVIAMNEIDFEIQPIPFAQKVYFVNE